MVFGVFLFQLGKVREGLFDPFGLSLPNAFSEVTGHPGNGPLSYAAGLLVICGDGVCRIGRVDVSTFAESSGEPEAGDDRGGRLFGVGGSIRGVVYMARENVKNIRELYVETYNKYQKFPKGNVVSNTLEVEQKGKCAVREEYPSCQKSGGSGIIGDYSLPEPGLGGVRNKRR